MVRFHHISLVTFVPVTNLNCGGLSAAISFGPTAMGGPLFLIAGGSGIVPLMAMLRHRERRNGRVSRFAAVFIQKSGRRHLSRRTRRNDAPRPGFACCQLTLTRQQPEGWRAIGEGSIKRCLLRRAFHPSKSRKFLSVGLLLSWRTSQGFWWNLDMTLSLSRRNASDLLE